MRSPQMAISVLGMISPDCTQTQRPLRMTRLAGLRPMATSTREREIARKVAGSPGILSALQQASGGPVVLFDQHWQIDCNELAFFDHNLAADHGVIDVSWGAEDYCC